MELGFLLVMSNGANTVLDMKSEFARRANFGLGGGQIDEILKTLDENLMLDNSRSRQAHIELKDTFRREKIRKPFLVGKSYPQEPGEIMTMIDGFYAGPDGPGNPPSEGKGPAARCLVAPHIDLKAGGPCFAQAYHALAKGKPPDRFVILGTGHHGTDNLFSLTRKTFETPLGMVASDEQFVDRLIENSPFDYLADEILHRTEHVIEFQVLLLQHLYRNSDTFSIVPILCSFEPEHFFHPDTEYHREIFADFTTRLQTTLELSTGTTCIIASVDLDHRGPRYGDDFNPTQETISKSYDADRELLKCFVDGDDKKFLDLSRKFNPHHKICGFSRCIHL